MRNQGKVTLDIITNIVGCTLQEPLTLNDRTDFKISHWETASADEMHHALKVPKVESCAEADCILTESDKVAELLKKDYFATIQCPGCHCVYPRAARNCRTATCDVINIRQALTEQQAVVHETHRAPQQRTRRDTVIAMRPQLVHVDSGLTVSHVERMPIVTASNCDLSARPVEVDLLEPCFVNPASLLSVEELLRHIGWQAGIKQYGGTKWDWLKSDM